MLLMHSLSYDCPYLLLYSQVVVTVEDRTDGPSFIFNCNCWIGKDKDNLQKYLLPEKNGKPMNKLSFDYCILNAFSANRSKLDKVQNADHC